MGRESGGDPFASLFAALKSSRQFSKAGVLFDGKIIDIQRETKGGFSLGKAIIEASGGGARLEIDFKNENLVARLDGDGPGGSP